ncbi:DUF6686 family protein [Sphingobacterium sp. LRF_L2]|uniref:DUF6686 family protein n=1 Tax=Sphingobacterium sp. LRF_L2 TaxID=3369421 RepID=UPI003F62BFB5
MKILTSNESGFISIREGHDLVHLSFKNLMLNFSLAEFCAFRRMTKQLLVESLLIQFPDGTRRIILRTPYSGITFSFEHVEILSLVDALDEAYYMKEVYSLLDKS